MPIDLLKRAAFVALFFVVAFISFSNSLFEIASAVLIALSLVSLVRSKSYTVAKDLFFAFAAFYLMMNLLSLTQTAYAAASLRGIFKVLKNLLLCFSAFYVIDSESRFKRIFDWILWVALLIGLDALIQGLTGVELIRSRPMTAYVEDTKRLTGPFHHANDFSAYLSFVTVPFFAVATGGLKLFPPKKYVWFVGGALVALVCLLGTYSRGAWLAVASALVLFVIFKRSKAVAALLLLTMVGAAFFAPLTIKARMVSIWDVRNGTVLERKTLWKESLRMIDKSPWLGLGVNTYAKNEPLYKSTGIEIDQQYAHNGYLQMAAEIGILGLLSFLLTVGYFLWASLISFLKSEHILMQTMGSGLVLGIFSFLVHSATDTDLQSLLLVNLLWLAMGIAWAGKRLVEK